MLCASDDNIPIVVCCDKIDEAKRHAKSKSTMLKYLKMHKINAEYFDISALASYNIEPVYLHIARKLLSDETLHIERNSYVLAEPEAIVPDCNFKSRAERELTGRKKWWVWISLHFYYNNPIYLIIYT